MHALIVMEDVALRQELSEIFRRVGYQPICGRLGRVLARAGSSSPSMVVLGAPDAETALATLAALEAAVDLRAAPALLLISRSGAVPCPRRTSAVLRMPVSLRELHAAVHRLSSAMQLS